MTVSNTSVLARLQREILPLQGLIKNLNNPILDSNLGQLRNAFPGCTFPLGAVHEFIGEKWEDTTAAMGFISGLLSSLMRSGSATLWIGADLAVFPTALTSFGIDPGKIIFIELKKENELLWTIEEALKCESLAAVVGCVRGLSFTASRRLQLAVEKSRVTGFILRPGLEKLNTTSCITRWKISSLPGYAPDGLPGVGFPRWNVELLKVRNGRPGNWQIECIAGRFHYIHKNIPVVLPLQLKTG